MFNKLLLTVSALVICTLLSSETQAEDLKSIVNLSGRWKFSIGDNMKWASADFDDSKWDDIYVPNSWEREGYKDYNGYAWYRTSFSFSYRVSNEFMYLQLGYIDDVDEVYLNGKLIAGCGQLPLNYKTAYTKARKYPIPIDLIKKNDVNTIAIRVYDHIGDGGIVRGNVGLYVDRQERYLDVNLAGYWSFETEDELIERKASGNKQVENKVFVPGMWEDYGYPDFDGKARYKTTFNVNEHLLSKELYLVLGYVDDIETVYINGQKIGSVVNLEKKEKTGLPYHIIFRGYLIPKEILNTDGPNVLSVVVYDQGGPGGIYYGPVGITGSEGYEALKHLNTKRKDFWQLFFD